ncbi:MAG: signal peptidase I [Candidatus Diapherotrites archaeon]|nr:signal peptidase I [Candidatus Diapherotrites archaeon]
MPSIARRVLVLFVIFFLFYFALILLAGTPKFLATIESNSMRPALERGDLLLLAKTNDYGVGDVIIFLKNGNVIVHRIIEVRGSAFVTKGDANGYVDRWLVGESEIIGEMVFMLPELGHLNLFLAGK